MAFSSGGFGWRFVWTDFTLGVIMDHMRDGWIGRISLGFIIYQPRSVIYGIIGYRVHLDNRKNMHGM